MTDKSITLLSDLQEAKQLASDLKRSEALSHSEALDHVASAHFGCGSYRELQARYRNHIDTLPVINDGVGRCPVCHMMFSSLDKDDIKDHRKTHQKYDEAALQLGFRTRGYNELEAIKRHAYNAIENVEKGSTDEAECWIQIFTSWFERSLNSAISGGYWKHHPSFETYCSMLIGSEPHGYLSCIRHLEDKYGRRCGQIVSGSSYWLPPKAKIRLESRSN